MSFFRLINNKITLAKKTSNGIPCIKKKPFQKRDSSPESVAIPPINKERGDTIKLIPKEIKKNAFFLFCFFPDLMMKNMPAPTSKQGIPKIIIPSKPTIEISPNLNFISIITKWLIFDMGEFRIFNTKTTKHCHSNPC
jgi:hypothetical protein